MALLQQNLTNAHTAKIQKRNNVTTSIENKVKTRKTPKKQKLSRTRKVRSRLEQGTQKHRKKFYKTTENRKHL